MRIHEVLDACVEYVSYEGVLGSDVLSLQQHLAKRDSSLDATSFAYLYTLLCQHPSIRIVISTYPLPSADQSVQLGSAPLPKDYSPPDSTLDVDFDRLYRQGKRGRELAYHLAGEEHKTSKEAVAVKRAEQERIRIEKKQGLEQEQEEEETGKKQKKKKKGLDTILGEDGSVLFTYLDEDDTGLGGEVVEKTDLAGLAEKWGSRLRIRCTDDEIYYRLTGSHQQVPKFTLPVMHTLQLAARSRDKGITAIELGPMIGASQGSLYYYMKVLVEQGICAKVPAVLHGSITNLLIFHPFLEMNENYRAIKKLGPVPTDVVEEEEEEPAIGDSSTSGFDFRAMTEQELMTGHIVKERLIQLLDHPALQNHLLRATNLLALIGWKDKVALRHRRAIPRHIAALVMDGVVERLEVGPKRVDCLRLTKYNPDYKGPVIKKDAAADEVAVTMYRPQDFSQAFQLPAGTPSNRTFERQLVDAILASGEIGVTYGQLREATNGMYKRSIEFYLVRSEDSWHTPQLRPTTLCSVMESASKERRLRVFSTPAYRAFMTAAGHAPDDAKHPALTEEAGRWANLDFRDFAVDLDDFWHLARRIADGAAVRKNNPKTQKGKGKGKVTRSESPELPSKKRALLYEDTVQVRGRPRKYIHVVDEEGKIRRMIIGQVHPHPDIPPVLIWVASKKLLVPAPESYTGLGKPPNVTAAQLKAGHSPKWFEKFPKFVNKGKAAKAEKRKAKGKKEDEDSGDEEEEEEDAPPKKKSKKKAVVDEEGAAPKKKSKKKGAVAEDEPEPKGERPKRSSRLSKVAPEPIEVEEPEEDFEIQPQEKEDPDFVIDPQLLAEPLVALPHLPPPVASPVVFIPPPRSPSIAAASPIEPIPHHIQSVSPITSFVPLPTSPDPPPISAILEAISIAPAQPKKRKRKTPPPPASDPPAKAAKKRAPKAKKAPEPDPPAPTAPPTHIVPTVGRSRQSEAHGRVDLAMIRRNNELIEVLRANGGVMTDTRFLQAHTAWTYKVAGTDAPYAPSVGYKMDRRIFKASVPVAEAEGKMKQTICSIPTTTGRWIQQQVLWLPETPKPEVDAYISSLAEATISSIALAPKKGKRTQVEDQAFTEAKVNGQTVHNAKAIIIKNGMRDDTPATIRRNALLQQPGVAATLLGYISGRWMRVWRFFEVLVEVLESGSNSKVSNSPFVFALPLIFEDIPVAAFYECIYTTTFDEDLEEWMSDPENRKTPLRDVPARFRPTSGGFAGAQSKAKYRTILITLCQLGLLSPLNPSPPATADFSVSPELHYKRTKLVTQATHFVVHAYAPIYHIAGAQPGLLGLLPLSTTAERNFFWSTTRSASLTPDVKELPSLSFEASIGLPLTAQITETLEVDADVIRMMRSPARWRSDIRLLEEQRDAIDSRIDWRRCEMRLTDEEIELCAYENALSVKFLKEELKRRVEQAKERAHRFAKRDEESAAALKKRREKNQRDLRDKLAEIRAVAKKEWEDRILQACQAVGTDCTRDLVTFVTHHTLSIPNRAKLSDKVIEDAVRLGIRVQQAQIATSEVKQKRDIWDRQVAPAGPVAGQRRRHAWTPHEDDLLIDVEAIIRARSRGKMRGRAAAVQVFPDIGNQSLLNRFKKLLSLPGKQQYFDRLEAAWHETWMAHRGIELVDEDPDSTSSFDLKHHVEFLRAHINKTNLRHGYVEESAPRAKVPDLPSESSTLVRQSEWAYGKMDHKTLVSVHDAEISDESKLAGYALTPLRLEEKVYESKLDRKKGILRACLKMIVTTANDVYDPAAAAAFLAPFPTPERVIEINSLVEDKVFIRQHTAAHTQRHFTYASVWHQMTEGVLSTELAGEAKALRAAVAQGEVKWSSVCKGGEIAALLEMTSDGIIDIEFDMNDIRPIRYLRGTYNTRSLDDDAFEFDLTIKQKAPSLSFNPILPLPQDGPTLASWSFIPEDVHVAATHLLDLVHAAGRDGLTRTELEEQTGYDSYTLNSIFASLAAESPPDVFWAGYDTARLISVEHWFDWTTGIAGGMVRVRPRRWTDIFGDMTRADWEKCLACVTSHIMAKPGIILAELRSRLTLILDRMEFNEVIQYLEEAGTVRRGWGLKDIVPPVEAMSLYEETQVGYWSNQSWT